MLRQVMQSAVSLARDAGGIRYIYPNRTGYDFHWTSLWQLFGKAHTDWKEAVGNFLSLMSYQRKDGSLPNFIGGVALAQNLIAPPLPAILLYHLYQFSPDRALALELVKKAFPAIFRFHQYIYTSRDPHEEGLPFIWHPDESGFLQVDFSATAGTEKVNWKQMLDKGNHYDLLSGELYRHHEFLVQDPMFLSLLTWANECLIKLGGLIRMDVSEVLNWHELTTYSINEKLWSEERHQFDAFDLKGSKPIVLDSIRAFMPLVGEIPTQEQAEWILKKMESEDFGGKSTDHYLCPSRALSGSGSDFFPEGTPSVQLDFNWMIIRGLLRYDFEDMARKMEKDSLDLVLYSGFWDSYDPMRYDAGPRGQGFQNSSKTASLLLDLMVRRKGAAFLSGFF